MRAENQRLSRANILANVEVGSLRARVLELEAEVAGGRRLRGQGTETSDPVRRLP